LISFGDYKKLTKLRVLNYIYIMRMFTSIDETLYPEVKERLLKIKKLCKYLDLLEKENDASKVYARLDSDQ
jgi:hypothetical protein